jgi:hypothetical protein
MAVYEVSKKDTHTHKGMNQTVNFIQIKNWQQQNQHMGRIETNKE